MFRRPVSCAVLVDFDNIVQIVGAPFGEDAEAWVRWLEDAQFDPGGRRRRLVRKMVYWNDHNERKWRPYFERAGFEAFNCPSLVKSKKSEADMRIALDAQRLAYEAKDIDEFAILSTDTDFVPLLNCLAELDKRTVAAANPNNSSFEIYKKHADIAISVDALRDACAYRRAVGFWGRWLIGLGLRPRDAAATAAREAAGEGAAVEPVARSATARLKRLGLWRRGEPHASADDHTGRPATPRRGGRSKADPALERAAEIIVDIARDAPGLPVARRTIERRLGAELPVFRTRGARPYLGCGDYREFLKAVAALRDDLRMHFYRNGGAAVSFREE